MFYDQLKRLREGKNLTQEQMAKMIGIAKNTYIGYEKGDREPRLNELIKMSKTLGVTMNELCLGMNIRTPRDDLAMIFDEIQDFDEKELDTFINVVQALVIKHHAEKIKTMTKDIISVQ